MNKPLTVFLCVSWWLLVATDYTYAYLDPGSGSMMLQLLLGGAAGLGVMLKMYWRQMLTRLGIKKEEEKRDSLGEASEVTTPSEPADSSKRHRELPR